MHCYYKMHLASLQVQHYLERPVESVLLALQGGNGKQIVLLGASIVPLLITCNVLEMDDCMHVSANVLKREGVVVMGQGIDSNGNDGDKIMILILITPLIILIQTYKSK